MPLDNQTQAHPSVMFCPLRHVLRVCGSRSASSSSGGGPKKTALYDLHVEHKGKMVEFGGFLLPIQYGAETISESHLHTRTQASLFDVSHMMQTLVYGRHRETFLESLSTADLSGMSVNSSALSLFLDKETGGILDDLIVTKCENHLYVVTNANRREADTELMANAQEMFRQRGKEVMLKFQSAEERSLVAVQGPAAGSVLQSVVEQDLTSVYFMRSVACRVAGVEARLTRCGYTGEDGFELSLPSGQATAVVEQILRTGDGVVKLAGLGARDTLRLEAGLCLYGNDIDHTTTPVSAGLMWTIGKGRKAAGDYPGAPEVAEEARRGPKLRRVGLVADSKGPPPRAGCELVREGAKVGRVTSGCPSPSLGTNIAMGYLAKELALEGYKVEALVRGATVPLTVVKMPFVPTNYYMPPKK